MKIKKISSLILIAILVISLVGCTSVNDRAAQLEKNSSTSSSVVEKEELPKEEEKIEPITIDFLAVGDNLIHDGIYFDAKRHSDNGTYDFSKFYEPVAKMIKKADISSINQETIISKSYPPASYPMFNSPPELGTHMVDIGFDVFNLANNHMLDKWDKGLIEAMDFWDENNVLFTGSYRNKEETNIVKKIEAKGITLGFVGVTESLNGMKLQNGSELVLSLGENEDFIKEQIENAKKEVDVVVVNIHWGVEYTHIPNERQKYLAKKLGEWGANIVIGHHPHVIQPMEYIENEDGTKTFVIYSLGNFISAQSKAATMVGGMVNIPITKEIDGTFTYENAKFTPLVTHYDSRFRNFRVYPYADYTQELAKVHGVRNYDAKFSYDYIGKVVEDVMGSNEIVT